jgi:mono/diheme cytochrome c family protein
MIDMLFGRAAIAVILLALSAAAAADDDAAVRKGARIYENNCSNCHGAELQNNSGIAFDLRRLRADEHERFVNSVLRGKNAMPSWDGKLTGGQIESLWAYIRANAYQ